MNVFLNGDYENKITLLYNFQYIFKNYGRFVTWSIQTSSIMVNSEFGRFGPWSVQMFVCGQFGIFSLDNLDRHWSIQTSLIESNLIECKV